jgi:hypothetical protein
MPIPSYKGHAMRFGIGALVGLLVLVLAFAIYLWQSLQLEKPATMRSLLAGMGEYKRLYKAYPPTLSALGGDVEMCSKGATSAAACLIDDVLASGEKSGYSIRYKPIDTLRNGKFDAFTINADPIAPERPKQPHFFTDQTGVIRVETGRPATAASPPVN